MKQFFSLSTCKSTFASEIVMNNFFYFVTSSFVYFIVHTLAVASLNGLWCYWFWVRSQQRTCLCRKSSENAPTTLNIYKILARTVSQYPTNNHFTLGKSIGFKNGYAIDRDILPHKSLHSPILLTRCIGLHSSDWNTVYAEFWAEWRTSTLVKRLLRSVQKFKYNPENVPMILLSDYM